MPRKRPASRNAPRSHDVAAHEAAHVVIGVSLGLELDRAVARPSARCLGHCVFYVGPGDAVAWALTLAAGVAYERAMGTDGDEGDLADLARLGYKHAAEVEALVLAASAMLAARRGVHRAVTRALLERDVDLADVEAIARGASAGDLDLD